MLHFHKNHIWMDDLPAPEELLKLNTCNCQGKEEPCMSRICKCKVNNMKCTSFCECNNEICMNANQSHDGVSLDTDGQEYTSE
jgi:hypothetical protein